MNRLRAEAIKTRRLASNSFAIHADRGVSLDSAFFGDSSASAMVLVAFSRERKPRALLFAPDKCNINGVNWPGFANENHLRAIRLLPTRLFHPFTLKVSRGPSNVSLASSALMSLMRALISVCFRWSAHRGPAPFGLALPGCQRATGSSSWDAGDIEQLVRSFVVVDDRLVPLEIWLREHGQTRAESALVTRAQSQ
jgi:hypothetical protein